jgi:hypothetical protein
MGAMEALLWLVFGCLCLASALAVVICNEKWTPRLALLGAALLLAGGLLLALFVFSGDPYTNGETSRWAGRESHTLVYTSWVATALGATGLFALSRRSTRPWVVAMALVTATALIVTQVLAATSQNLN